MPKVVKLSIDQLKSMIGEAKAGMKGGSMGDVEKVAKKTKEVEADEYANTLEKEVDYYKGLKEHEQKLVKKLEQVRGLIKQKAKKINEARKKKAKKA